MLGDLHLLLLRLIRNGSLLLCLFGLGGSRLLGRRRHLLIGIVVLNRHLAALARLLMPRQVDLCSILLCISAVSLVCFTFGPTSDHELVK